MAILNYEATDSFTAVAADSTTATVEIKSKDNAEQVTAFIDDNAGGAPADFTIIAERYSNAEDRWMELTRSSITGATEPESVTDDAVPSRMRYSITNDSAGAADFRISLVSY